MNQKSMYGSMFVRLEVSINLQKSVILRQIGSALRIVFIVSMIFGEVAVG